MAWFRKKVTHTESISLEVQMLKVTILNIQQKHCTLSVSIFIPFYSINDVLALAFRSLCLRPKRYLLNKKLDIWNHWVSEVISWRVKALTWWTHNCISYFTRFSTIKIGLRDSIVLVIQLFWLLYSLVKRNTALLIKKKKKSCLTVI